MLIVLQEYLQAFLLTFPETYQVLSSPYASLFYEWIYDGLRPYDHSHVRDEDVYHDVS